MAVVQCLLLLNNSLLFCRVGLQFLKRRCRTPVQCAVHRSSVDLTTVTQRRLLSVSIQRLLLATVYTSVTTPGVLMYRHLMTRRNLYREIHREIHDKINTVGEKGGESCGVSWPQAQHMSVHCRRPLTHVRCRPIHNSSHAAIRSNDEITHAAVHPVQLSRP